MIQGQGKPERARRSGFQLVEPSTRDEIRLVAQAIASVDRGLRWTPEQQADLEARIAEWAERGKAA